MSLLQFFHFSILISISAAMHAQTPVRNLVDSIITEQSKARASSENEKQKPAYSDPIEEEYQDRSLPAFLSTVKTKKFKSTWSNRPMFHDRGWIESGALFSNRPSPVSSYLARSQIVADVLRNSYKVDVPFEREGWQRIYDRSQPIASNLPKRRVQISCGAVASTFFAGGVSAVSTVSSTPQSRHVDRRTGKARSTDDDADDPKRYLADLFSALEYQCPDQKFISAHKDFLNQIGATIGTEQAEQAALLSQQAATARDEAETRRRNAEIRAANAEREATAAKAARLASLKSGVAPEGRRDGLLLFNPQDGYPIVAAPPIQPDGALYALRGKLVRKDDGDLVFEVRSNNDVRYFIVKTNSATILTAQLVPRFETNLIVFGRFTGLKQYTTVSGTSRVAPTFTAVMLTDKD